MVSIIWTETANNNLIAIREYIALDSVLQADMVLDGIFSKAQILTRFPEVGKVIKELPNGPYRELLYFKYRIIYRVAGKQVYILTIEHSARLLRNNPIFNNIL
jgi:plasmid stabilization system protein ParE